MFMIFDLTVQLNPITEEAKAAIVLKEGEVSFPLLGKLAHC